MDMTSNEDLSPHFIAATNFTETNFMPSAIYEDVQTCETPLLNNEGRARQVTFAPMVNSPLMAPPPPPVRKLCKVDPHPDPPGIKGELLQLISMDGFRTLSDNFILTHLIGLVKSYEAKIKPELNLHTDTPMDLKLLEAKAIPLTSKKALAQACHTRTKVGSQKEEPLIGIIIYVGSPTDGEMVVINSQTVHEWLIYQRAAIQQKVITAEDNLLSVGNLAGLVNLRILPGDRHSVTIKYGSDTSCNALRHVTYTWMSAQYPCVVNSCQTNNDVSDIK